MRCEETKTGVFEKNKEVERSAAKERIPLSEVTGLMATSSSSSFNTPNELDGCRYQLRSALQSERRKRSQEISLADTTPPDSMRLRPDVICTQQTPGFFKFRRRLSNQPPIDYFKLYSIPVEVLRIVFQYLNKRDMTCAMQTCQFFYAAGSSSSNWHFLDINNCHIHDTGLAVILGRRVQICRMSDAKITATPGVPMSFPALPDGSRMFYSLTHLDIGRATFGRIETLHVILAGCVHLQALCLESVYLGNNTEEIGEYIGQNVHLRYLDLSLTRGLTAEAVNNIVSGCRGLIELNLAWCDLDASAVRALVMRLSHSLQKINLSGTRNKLSIEDDDVYYLTRSCPQLCEIDLSDNLSLSDKCVHYLIELEELGTLSLNRCYKIDPQCYLLCEQIPLLNVIGTMTDQGEYSLRHALKATRINGDILNYIAKPTIPPAVSSIWQQRTRDHY